MNNQGAESESHTKNYSRITEKIHQYNGSGNGNRVKRLESHFMKRRARKKDGSSRAGGQVWKKHTGHLESHAQKKSEEKTRRKRKTAEEMSRETNVALSTVEYGTVSITTNDHLLVHHASTGRHWRRERKKKKTRIGYVTKCKTRK